MRSKAAIIICSLLVVMSLTCSCGKGQQKPVRTAKTEKIRADLRVGVMPVMDCLPLYYASENRLIGKDAGRVELVTYFSALQCAAALRDGKVDMAYISLPEAIWLRGQGCRIRALASTDCDMTVVTNRSKRLKKLSELSGRTIAISRHNPSDLLLDEIATITGIKPYYWGVASKSEVEFVFETRDGRVIPVEVKSGKNVGAKSVRSFADKYEVPYVVKVTAKNFGFENGVRNLPLYAAFTLDEDADA